MYFNATVRKGATVQRATFTPKADVGRQLLVHQKLLGGRALPGSAGETYRLRVP